MSGSPQRMFTSPSVACRGDPIAVKRPSCRDATAPAAGTSPLAAGHPNRV
jgi:hypothetical protein